MWKLFDKGNTKIRLVHDAIDSQICCWYSKKIVQVSNNDVYFANPVLKEDFGQEEPTVRNPSRSDVELNLRSVSNESVTDDNFRINDLNIQMLSRSLYKQLFSKANVNKNQKLIDLALSELKKHGLPGKLQKIPDVDLQLPKIYNDNLEEHFYELGRKQSEQYKFLVDELVKPIPSIPKKWEFTCGWTKYEEGKDPISVEYPDEDSLVFDVEVCCKEGQNPVIATAVNNNSWYCWISNDLYHNRKKIRKENFYNYATDEFVPLESGQKTKNFRHIRKPKIVVGHHVSYDRARIKEQYWLDRTGARFLDTMSLHICISGVTSDQKMMLKSGKAKNEWWNEFTSLNNSLREVYKYYCGGELRKEERDIFVSGELQDIRNDFQNLVTYCAKDTEATHKILKHLWPSFLERFPHPVTFAGMLELSTCYLPVNLNWRRYIQDSQDTYDDLNAEAKFLLSQQADKSCQLLHGERYKEDLWLWNQDWSIKQLKLKKVKPLTKKQVKEKMLREQEESVSGKSLDLSPDYESDEFDRGKMDKLDLHFTTVMESKKQLPVKVPHLAGYPEWYRNICNQPKVNDWRPGPVLLTTSIKCVPKLLSLTWNFMPLHHLRTHGWCYLVPFKTDISLPKDEAPHFPLKKFIEYYLRVKRGCIVFSDKVNIDQLSTKLRDYLSRREQETSNVDFGLVKLPHKNGDELNVGNPLSRDFINKFSDLEISSSNANTHRIIGINRKLTYWKNNKDRIENQLVVWLKGKELPEQLNGYNMGVILPQVIVSGTLTRRAVESTWMTASNADCEKIGSELRSMIQAPPGFSIVGADVDSQELWISSLFGDSYFAKEHGSTAFAWMTLSGQKSEGTDMHTVTAKTMGISRNDAKVVNYARIYGAGSKFSERLLKQFVPGISDADANKKARTMFQTTKGNRLYRLKQHVLPDHLPREFTRGEARQLCVSLSQEVDDLFEWPEWTGGSESAMFNSLEEIACKAGASTPFLRSRLSKAVEPRSSTDTSLLPTRINWVVQSSAVDFLHLMLVCMRWLIDPKIRFCLSFHDEVRYLVPNELKYETALALHVTNLLVRSFCVQRVGMSDLPQSVAFFSSVDVDSVLRKDAFLDSVTPSNPYGLSKGYGIPHGESLDIVASIEKAAGKIGTYQMKINKNITTK